MSFLLKNAVDRGRPDEVKAPRVILLLTATVAPFDVPFLVVTDPAERLEEYRKALQWYASRPGIDRLLFCENSGHDLSRLRDGVTSGRVEMLQYTSTGASQRGRGYGELGIIRSVVASLDPSETDTVLLKVTGRYIVHNLQRLLTFLTNEPFADVVADLRTFLTYADSRVFAFTPRFASQFLLPQAERVDDRSGFYFEHALARAVHLAVAEGLTWRPWGAEPDVVGVCGATGRPYRRGWFRYARRSLRRASYFKGLRGF